MPEPIKLTADELKQNPDYLAATEETGESIEEFLARVRKEKPARSGVMPQKKKKEKQLTLE